MFPAIESLMPLLAAAAEHGKEEKPPLPVMGMAAVYLGVLIAIGIVAFLINARNGYGVRGPKSGPAKLAEHGYLFVEKIALSVIGSHGRQFLPFLITIWSVILVGNIAGLILHVSPTASMSFNLGMSLLTVGYVQYCGIRQNGLFGHLKHFAGPKLPANIAFVSVLIFMVEILSEFAKIISLALRLFGNIVGGKLVVKNLDDLSVIIGQDMLKIADFHIEVPIGSVLIPIKLLTAIIQPFVWIMLTCVYLGMVTHEPHDHDDHHGPDAAHSGGTAAAH